MGEDYNHGTGHGVGYLLNVHEGPQSFRWKSPAELPAPVLEEGMITSDEPGYYAENEFGIRHENLVVCKKAEKTSYGQFMKFEPLTLVPFDLEGIDPEQMDRQVGLSEADLASLRSRKERYQAELHQARLTVPAASKTFVNNVTGDVTLIEYDGMYHEPHNEPEQQEVFEDVLAWMEPRL